VRNGGGVWNTPTVDPDWGLIYFAAGNPTPDLDGSARKGINLFTNSIVALDVNTGKLRWYFQQVHHDIWDYDSSAPTILCDTKVGGQTVKAIAEANKDGYVYIVNRETGQPINPVVETSFSQVTDVPGEEVFPTQPIPYTVLRRPMEPYVPIYPVGVPEGFTDQVVPFLTPLSANRHVIGAPSLSGGSLYNQPAFSLQTGLVYIPGIDRLNSLQAVLTGAKLKPGEDSFAGDYVQPPLDKRPERGTLTAYDPATGELVWQAQLPGQAQAGAVATAGNLVFQGTGFGIFHGFNASTGEEVFRFFTGDRIQAAPMTYMVNGRFKAIRR
jgi:alcohol dehydrogenase (cytochrome c)